MPVLFWQCDHFMGVNIHIKYPKSKSNRSFKKIIIHVIYRVTPQFCSFFYIIKNNIVIMMLNTGCFWRCAHGANQLASVSRRRRAARGRSWANQSKQAIVIYAAFTYRVLSEIPDSAASRVHMARATSRLPTEKTVVHLHTIYIFLIIAVLQEIKHQNRTTHKISVGKHRCATIKNQTE